MLCTRGEIALRDQEAANNLIEQSNSYLLLLSIPPCWACVLQIHNERKRVNAILEAKNPIFSTRVAQQGWSMKVHWTAPGLVRVRQEALLSHLRYHTPDTVINKVLYCVPVKYQTLVVWDVQGVKWPAHLGRNATFHKDRRFSIDCWINAAMRKASLAKISWLV